MILLKIALPAVFSLFIGGHMEQYLENGSDIL